MDNQPVLSKAEGPVQGQNTGVPQTPVSPTPIPPPPAVQPPQTPPSGPEALRAGGPKSRKKILFLLLLAVLIAIVAGYLFLSSKKPFEDTTGLAAKVGEQKITVSQASEFANECSLEQKEAAEYLVDNIVLEQWAQDEKITFSKEDQKAEEIRISGKEAAINCIAVQAKVNLLREKLSQKTDELSEGKFSEPFIQKVNISLCQILETDCPAEYVDSAWVIVKVEKIGKGYEESGEKL